MTYAGIGRVRDSSIAAEIAPPLAMLLAASGTLSLDLPPQGVALIELG